MRRDKIQIIADILRVLLSDPEELKKTQIVYQANLDFKRVEKYLAFMLEKELIAIAEAPGGRRYRITDKGIMFLRDYERVKATL